MKHAYGIDDSPERIFKGNGCYEEIQGWNKSYFVAKDTFIIKVIAVWTEKPCKLTFFYNEEKICHKPNDPTMKLPELEEGVVLYPCVTPYNKDAYFIIRFV